MQTAQDTPAAIDQANETFGPQTLRGFEVELDNFQGPFDLLLRLIARRDMDLTEVALAAVTDEFLVYLRVNPDLSSATDFLVVAATLLEMKAAALLPQVPGEEPASEDLEARDLLFSRLLQYRAFKEAAAVLQERWVANSGSVPRSVPLEERYARLLPELKWTVTPALLAELAAQALAEKPRPDLAEHVARASASLEQELTIVSRDLRTHGTRTFGQLIADASEPVVVVTRFLALLELYRQGRVHFEQPEPMAPLMVVWSAGKNARLQRSDKQNQAEGEGDDQ